MIDVEYETSKFALTLWSLSVKPRFALLHYFVTCLRSPLVLVYHFQLPTIMPAASEIFMTAAQKSARTKLLNKARQDKEAEELQSGTGRSFTTM